MCNIFANWLFAVQNQRSEIFGSLSDGRKLSIDNRNTDVLDGRFQSEHLECYHFAGVELYENGRKICIESKSDFRFALTRKRRNEK